MKRTLLASLALVTMAIPSIAFAQAKPAKGPAPEAAPRVKNYDFDADNIDGELVKPEGEFMNARKYAEHGSLIRIRTDFIREIVKSAEDL